MTPTQAAFAGPVVAAHAPTVITNSSLQTLRTCSEKYRLRYIENLTQEIQPDYFRLGGAVHEALDVMGREQQSGRTRDEAIVLAEVALHENYAKPPASIQSDQELLKKWYYESITALCLYRGHCWYWEQEQFETVRSEISFAVPILNPETGYPTPNYKHGGKIDKLIRLADGRIGIQEYKTTSEDLDEASDYWQRLKIDTQVSGYFVAGQKIGQPIAAVVYDVMRKPTIRPTQVPYLDPDGIKIVHDANGERVRTKDGKKWRQTSDTELGYVLQTRAMTLQEWSDKLMADIYENPARYYARREIVRLPSDLEDFKAELWAEQKVLAERERNNRWAKNTSACLGRSRCEFFTICTNRLNVSESVPDGFVRVADPHVELT